MRACSYQSAYKEIILYMQGGRWSSGKDISGKMADSTASGPLWQQRPYPAPGQALKSKDKPRLGEEAGPTMPH